MRSARFDFCLALLLACTACDVRVGDGSWDSGFWDDEDAGDEPRDAARPDAHSGDDDAGEAPRDAAVGGDASADASTDAGQPDAGEQPDNMYTPEDVAGIFARGTCSALERCLGPVLLRDSLSGRDCVDFRSHVFAERELHWLAKSVALQRLTFRADLLARCERDLGALGCDVQSRRVPSSCEDALEGKADLDEACAIDQECTGAAFCDRGMQETCPGTCAEPQTSGLPCTASAQCADGLVCRSRSCARPLETGDACVTHLGYGECALGFACQGASDDYTCQPIETVYVRKRDESCDVFGALCTRDLVCESRSAQNTQGVCAPPVAAGADCRRAVPSQCPAQQYCKDAADGVSTRAVPGAVGHCSDLPLDGQVCVAEIGCRPGAVCVEGKCYSLQPDGAECPSNVACFSGSCFEGTCAAPLDCNAGG